MTTYECFQSAARIETLAQELYAGLAESFAGRPHLRQLFAQLSEEEEQHAHRVKLLSRHQGRTPWAAEAMGRIAESLEGMAAEVESMKADFTRPGRVADPGEVLRRVVELERRFGSIHAEQLARSADPEVAKLFSVLAAQDARHRALIEGAGGREVQPGRAGA
jgi:rubrerythrin